MQHVRPHHGETLLDGTAQSVKYGKPLRNGPGQPDNVNSQKATNSQHFIVGNDATEFVNRVNDEVRKGQNRMSNVASEGEKHSKNLRNVHGCDDEWSDIHGEEFPRQSEFHHEYIISHIEENVRHISKIGKRTR